MQFAASIPLSSSSILKIAIANQSIEIAVGLPSILRRTSPSVFLPAISWFLFIPFCFFYSSRSLRG
jgi:hypothetical protein